VHSRRTTSAASFVRVRAATRKPTSFSSPVGSGDVAVFSNGTVQLGTWSRENRTDPFTLTGADGAPIKLMPGRTFVELGDVADHQTAWG